MQAIYAKIDQGIGELQDATKAFLTDQYNNGDYVATTDDIAELQAATAAFLADQTDGEFFNLDCAGHGVLLPGEQFLLPISTAVGRARSEQDTVREVIDLVDECLDPQVLFEDVPDTPLLEATPKPSNDQDVVYTSFVDILGPDSLPKTPPFDARTPTVTISMTPTLTTQMTPTITPQMATAPDSEHPWVSLEDILKCPDEVDRLLENCDDHEEYSSRSDTDVSDTISDISDIAYDGPDALCPAHASHSAAFFDPTTETLVRYTSLDTLLGMDYQNGDIAYDGPDALDPVHASYSAAFFDPTTETLVRYTSLDTLLGMDYQRSCIAESDRKSDQFTVYNSDSDTDSDEDCLDITNGDLEPFITEVHYSFLHIDTDLSTISEGDEPFSAVSDSSVDFANRRSFLHSLTQRRLDFLADEEDLSATPTSTTVDEMMEELHNETAMFGDAELPFDMETADKSNEMFTHDLWNNDPDLTLTMPIGQHHATGLIGEFEHELFKTLTAVLQAIRSRSSVNPSTFADDFKRELYLLMGNLQNLVPTEHLEDSVDR